MPNASLAAGSMQESAWSRQLTVLFLYVGQGIPIGLFDFAIPAWLATKGASAADIAFVVFMTGLPWSLKFIAGFIMDRYTYFPMGRRRCWLIGAQLLIVASLLVFAAIDPSPQEILILGIVALVVNTAVVFQDVAADGLLVDILPEPERAIGGGFSQGGHTLGVAISGALSGALVIGYGTAAAYTASALLVAVITTYIIATRERPGEKRLPWSAGQSHEANLVHGPPQWLPILKEALSSIFRPISLSWLILLLGRGFTYGTLLIALPLIAANETGWLGNELTTLNGTAQLVAGISAMAIGGLLVAKIGTQRAMIAFQCLFIAGFAVSVLFQDRWVDPAFVTGMVFGWIILYAFHGICGIVFNMRLSPPRVAATQFSIFMAVQNQGTALAGILVAAIAMLAEPRAMLIMLIGVQAVMTATLLIVKMPRRQIGDPEEQIGDARPAIA